MSHKSIYQNTSNIYTWYGQSVTVPSIESLRFVPFASSCMGIAISLLNKTLIRNIRVGLSSNVATAYASPDQDLIVISDKFMHGYFDAIGYYSRMNSHQTMGIVLGVIVHEIGHFEYSPKDLMGYIDYIRLHTKKQFEIELARHISNILEDIYIEDRISQAAPTLSWSLSEMNKFLLTDYKYRSMGITLKNFSSGDNAHNACNLMLFAKVTANAPRGTSAFAKKLFKLARTVIGKTELKNRFALAAKIYELIAADPKPVPSPKPKKDAPIFDNKDQDQDAPDDQDQDQADDGQDNDAGISADQDGQSAAQNDDSNDQTDDQDNAADDQDDDDQIDSVLSSSGDDDQTDDDDDQDSQSSSGTADDQDQDGLTDDDQDDDQNGQSGTADQDDLTDDQDGQDGQSTDDYDGGSGSSPDYEFDETLDIPQIDTMKNRNAAVPDYSELPQDGNFRVGLDGHTVTEFVIDAAATGIEMDRRYVKLSETTRQRTNANVGYGTQQSTGRNLRQIHRIMTDRKVFSTRISQETIKPMEIILLLDCSISMNSVATGLQERKIVNASSAVLGAAVGLTNGKALVTVYGHTADEDMQANQIILYPLMQSGESLTLLARRLQTLALKYANGTRYLWYSRDGYAIHEICKKFRSKDKRKVLIVISDGEPNCGSGNYRQSRGIDHTRQMVNRVRQSGIDVFSISIDAAAFTPNNVIYGQDFNTCSNDANAIDTLIRQLYK